MAEGQSRNVPVVPQASQALNQFKQQVASELGINNYQGYLGDVPSRLNGAVGGHMVKRMIALAEQNLAGGGTIGAVGGTAGGVTGQTGTRTTTR